MAITEIRYKEEEEEEEEEENKRAVLPGTHGLFKTLPLWPWRVE